MKYNTYNTNIYNTNNMISIKDFILENNNKFNVNVLISQYDKSDLLKLKENDKTTIHNIEFEIIDINPKYYKEIQCSPTKNKELKYGLFQLFLWDTCEELTNMYPVPTNVNNNGIYPNYFTDGKNIYDIENNLKPVTKNSKDKSRILCHGGYRSPEGKYYLSTNNLINKLLKIKELL